jgi:hypothetical protein
MDEVKREEWAILELMGHRRLAGRVEEVDRYGVKMCRIDIPDPTDPAKFITQRYGGQAIYCETPCTEETARAISKLSQPSPVNPWELPQRALPASDDDMDPQDE